MKSFVLLLAIVVGALAQKTTYENYKVYSVTVANENDAELLSQFEENEHFDFWSHLVRDGVTDIMVSPFVQEEFENFLIEHDIKYNIKIKDVESVFEKERILQWLAPKSGEGRIAFTKYHRYADILTYVRQLAQTHSSIVKVETIGKTTEGRDMVVVKISSGGSGKPTILVDGGIHAREWIAPAQVLYIIQELVENKNNANLIKNVDWHIIPVINPDGYEYTHTNTRMWRKTRSRGASCYGTDGNRNFDFHWGETGASANECSETYMGRSAFSEPETKVLRDYVLKNPKIYKLYLTFHSYGQYLLYPWGYTSALPSNAKELQSLGDSVNKAIQAVAGTRYTVGSSTNVLYAAAGGSDDWVMGVAGVSLSYTIELPGGGSQGFDLPPSRILPVVKETFEGIKVYHNYIEKLYSN